MAATATAACSVRPATSRRCSRVTDLRVAYGGIQAVKGISFEVRRANWSA